MSGLNDTNNVDYLGPEVGRRSSWRARPLSKWIIVATAVFATWSFSTDLMSMLTSVEYSGFSSEVVISAISLATLTFGILGSTIRSTYGSLVIIVGASLQVLDQMPLLAVAVMVINAFVVALTATRGFARVYVAVALLWIVVHIALVPENVFLIYGFVPCVLILFGVGRHLADLRRQNAEIRWSAQREAEFQRAALEAERRNIASDLHDVVAHDMTVVTMQADAARVSGGDEQTRATLRAIAEAGRQSLQDLRAMMRILAPHGGESTRPATPVSDQLLRREVESAVDRLTDLGLDIAVEMGGNPDELKRGVQMGFAPVIRECATNIIKHATGAEGGTATIELKVDDEMVALRIENPLRDGSPVLKHEIPSGGFGLKCLAERVHTWGGTFNAEPQRGRWIVTATLSRNTPAASPRELRAGRATGG